ncbi:MAG: TolC family protein [Phycisphaerales bacterium]|nr:TolC family protein [Phycisphaerales bacterium]
MRRTIVFILSGLMMAGCSPEAHRRSADEQVQRILADRKETTLGYQPQSTAPTTVEPAPQSKAFAQIPTTPLAPPTTAPIEPAHVELSDVPLGPPVPSTQPTSNLPELFGEQLQRRLGSDRLELGPPAPNAPGAKLDLFRSIEYAVQHSREYQTQMEGLYLAALDVTLQRHLFEPRPFVTTGLHYKGGQRDVAYRSALTATASAGVRQQLPYGGEVVAQTLVSFVDTLTGAITEGESAQVALSGSVPLLRGAGMVNLEPLISSERQMVYQVRAFEDYRRQFVVDIAAQYFRLLTQQQGLSNRRLNYRNLASLTERTQALYEAGKISFLEVQRSLQALLTAESSLVDAQESYQSAIDRFKIALGMPIDQELEVIPVELSLEVPHTPVEDVIKLAMQYRLDIQTARDQVDDARRQVSVAKNGLLPDLDLDADVSVGNPVGFGPASDIENRTLNYGAGVTLDLPVDRVAERNTYRRSLILLQRAQRAYESMRDQVAISARDALRAIRSAQVSLEIQRLGIELARRRLDYAGELLKEGQVTSRDVVEAQSSLLTAQDAYDQARAQLQISVLRYLQETGTLRVDPRAGALGQAMDREALMNKRASVE